MSEFEKFYTKLWKQGESSIVLTVPFKLVKFVGFKEGDEVTVMIKKNIESGEASTPSNHSL